MAYYNNPDEENQDNTQGMNGAETQTQSSPAPIQLSNQSSTVTAPQKTGQQKPAASGTGTSFGAYAKANQGKAQESLNSATAQSIANAGQGAQNSIKQATNKFGTLADQGALGGQQSRSTALTDVQNTINKARNVTAQPTAPVAQTAPTAGLATEVNQNPNTAKSTAAAAPVAPNPLSQIAKADQDRFQSVINAQYQGPESLRQAGLYNPASQKVQTAQGLIDNSKTANGREELLRQIYQQNGNYTSGLNKLDSALLNSSQQGVQNLQNVANAQGNLGQKLDQAQIGSANTAQNYTNQVKDINEQARNAFTTGKTAEEQATEDRLNGVISNWDKLPQYFKDIINNKGTANKQILDQQIADYSKSHPAPDANAVAQAQQAMAAANSVYAGGFTTYKQQQERQAALADAHKKYDSILNAQSAYDNGLNSIKSNFNNNQVALNPEEAAILGLQSGQGLYNLGADAIKTGVADKSKLISKDEQARQAALASLAGLDNNGLLSKNLLYTDANKAGTQSALDALDLSGTQQGIQSAEKNFQDYATGANLTGFGAKKNKTNGRHYTATQSANLGDVLKNAGYQFGSPENTVTPNSDILKALANTSHGSASGDPSGLAGIGDAYGQTLDLDGKSLGQNYVDLAGLPLSWITGALGMGSIGNAIGGALGFGGANTAESKNDAKQFAAQDLQNKIQGALGSSGFNNRIAVGNSDATNSRLTALQQLLANMDKTNS